MRWFLRRSATERWAAAAAAHPTDSTDPSGGGKARADWKEELAAHFSIEFVLGQGGYSTVFSALRRADGQRYALKVTELSRLTDWSRQAAVREARVLAALGGCGASRTPHPCVTTFREAFALGSRLCIVTDAADGGDLHHLLQQRCAAGSALTEEEIWPTFLQVALAVRHLHAHRVLHRDLKPANVLLRSGGVAQLTDLGVCGQLSAVFTRKEAGSPQYRAPEMWLSSPYSFSADLWSLGCLLYEMAAGRPLFAPPPGETCADAALAAVRQQVLALEAPPALPPGFSAELGGVLAALLRPSPAQRLSADELLVMPAVAARLATLPPAVRAAEAALQQAAGTGGCASCEACRPAKLSSFAEAAVNACMPPSAYGSSPPGLLEQRQQHLQLRGRSRWWSGGARARDASAGSGSAGSTDAPSSSDGIASLASLEGLDLAMPSPRPNSHRSSSRGHCASEQCSPAKQGSATSSLHIMAAAGAAAALSLSRASACY